MVGIGERLVKLLKIVYSHTSKIDIEGEMMPIAHAWSGLLAHQAL